MLGMRFGFVGVGLGLVWWVSLQDGVGGDVGWIRNIFGWGDGVYRECGWGMRER